MGRVLRALLPLALTALVSFLPASGEAAETAQPGLSILDVDVRDYPLVRANVSVTGLPESAVLTTDDFDVTENGLLVGRVSVRPLAGEPRPVAVALLIDTSASMKGQPLASAIAAARLFIDNARPADEIAVVAFSSAYGVVSDFTSDKARLAAALGRLKAGGDTAAYDALIYALTRLERHPIASRYAIILTDGADTSSRTTLRAADVAVKSAGVPVVAVALRSSEFEPAAIGTLAADSGGRLLVAPNPEALAGVYGQLAKELHSQYELTYVSLRPAADELGIVVDADIAGTRVRSMKSAPNPDAGITVGRVKTRSSPPASSLWTRAMVAAASFTTAFLFALVAFSIVFREEKPLKRQMEFYRRMARERAGPERRRAATETRLGALIRRIVSGWRVVEYARIKLERAGLALQPAEFVMAHFFFVFILGLIAWSLTGNLMVSGAVIAIATAAPLVLIQIIISQRKKAFHMQLPDVLSMISGSFRAGSSFMQALSIVVDESEAPISSEFRRVLAEIRLGRSVRDALDRMADRVDLPEFRWTVMAIDIQHEVGGNLAEVLETLAETIRESNAVKRQIGALAAEGKLSALILIILPFVQALLLYLVNPEYMLLLFTEPLGLVMVGVAGTLLVLGALWLRKMIAIEV